MQEGGMEELDKEVSSTVKNGKNEEESVKQSEAWKLKEGVPCRVKHG